MEEFLKKSCGISTYDQWNLKPQISSIFHFDRVSDGQMAHVLDVKHLNLCWKKNWSWILILMLLCFWIVSFVKTTKTKQSHVLFSPNNWHQRVTYFSDAVFNYKRMKNRTGKYGPLYVLWQVSFGCWVTWSILSWQKYYKGVFFPKAVFEWSNLQLYQKNLFGTWQFGKNWCFGQFFSQFFLLRGKSERIESIHFAESLGLSCWETEKEVLLPITQLWERRHSYNTLVSLR